MTEHFEKEMYKKILNKFKSTFLKIDIPKLESDLSDAEESLKVVMNTIANIKEIFIDEKDYYEYYDGQNGENDYDSDKDKEYTFVLDKLETTKTNLEFYIIKTKEKIKNVNL